MGWFVENGGRTHAKCKRDNSVQSLTSHEPCWSSFIEESCTTDFPVTTLSLLSVLWASSGTTDRMTTVIDQQVTITEGLGQTITEVNEWHGSVVNSMTGGPVVAKPPYLVQLLIKGSRQEM